MTPDQIAKANAELRSKSPLEIVKWAIAQSNGLDIVSEDKNFNSLKVSPLFYWSDADMEKYLAEHNLPNEWDYFDPAKADEKRECGLHASWGGEKLGSGI